MDGGRDWGPDWAVQCIKVRGEGRWAQGNFFMKEDKSVFRKEAECPKWLSW